ncbi:MAG: peptide deformylase [Rhodobacter sp.]|nr:peptide deformylase [Rhodobacter sp.]
MTAREILLWPDPRLREICDPVSEVTEDIRALADDLFDTMYRANGRGLAAPQIGVAQQVFVLDAGWKRGQHTPRAMVNPSILASSTAVCDIEEACLSIPGLAVTVRRPAEISVLWIDLDGTQHTGDFGGIEARIIQHEFAHLVGQTIFDEFSPEESAVLQAGYMAGRA